MSYKTKHKHLEVYDVQWLHGGLKYGIGFVFARNNITKITQVYIGTYDNNDFDEQTSIDTIISWGTKLDSIQFLEYMADLITTVKTK